jgi:hypothetical protein
VIDVTDVTVVRAVTDAVMVGLNRTGFSFPDTGLRG